MNFFGVNEIMEVDGTLLTILGVSAGILILTGWVEQIYKGYKTKSMKDISKFFSSSESKLGFLVTPGQKLVNPKYCPILKAFMK